MSGAGGAMSKAAKKNAKRHAKKQAASGQPVTPKGGSKSATMTPADLVPVLKAELEEAKAANDLARAGELREQIWVLGDLVKGVKTDKPEAELAPIIAKLEALMDAKKVEQSKAKDVASAPSADPEKRIKNLRKKLEQIEKLKERQAKGEKLEDGQLEKIKNEEKTLEDIAEIEKSIEH